MALEYSCIIVLRNNDFREYYAYHLIICNFHKV